MHTPLRYCSCSLILIRQPTCLRHASLQERATPKGLHNIFRSTFFFSSASRALRPSAHFYLYYYRLHLLAYYGCLIDALFLFPRCFGGVGLIFKTCCMVYEDWWLLAFLTFRVYTCITRAWLWRHGKEDIVADTPLGRKEGMDREQCPGIGLL